MSTSQDESECGTSPSNEKVAESTIRVAADQEYTQKDSSNRESLPPRTSVASTDSDKGEQPLPPPTAVSKVNSVETTSSEAKGMMLLSHLNVDNRSSAPSGGTPLSLSSWSSDSALDGASQAQHLATASARLADLHHWNREASPNVLLGSVAKRKRSQQGRRAEAAGQNERGADEFFGDSGPTQDGGGKKLKSPSIGEKAAEGLPSLASLYQVQARNDKFAATMTTTSSHEEGSNKEHSLLLEDPGFASALVATSTHFVPQEAGRNANDASTKKIPATRRTDGLSGAGTDRTTSLLSGAALRPEGLLVASSLSHTRGTINQDQQHRDLHSNTTSLLPPEKIDASIATLTQGEVGLEEGDTANTSSGPQRQWIARYRELIEFRRVNQHCNVPFSYIENQFLAQWVKRQRYQYKLRVRGKHSQLTEERQKLLESIGFVWDSHEAAWEENFAIMKNFYTTHKHCHVPGRMKRLSTWAKRQRRQFKFWQSGQQSTLTIERVRRMNEIQFPRFSIHGAGMDEASLSGHSGNGLEAEGGNASHPQQLLAASRNDTSEGQDPQHSDEPSSDDLEEEEVLFGWLDTSDDKKKETY